MLRFIWVKMLSPLVRRPSLLQVAALPWRRRKGHLEILLVTSLDTGSWILPKGWPMGGRDAAGAAAEEAWEEAGVEARGLCAEPLGQYRYTKRLKGEVPMRCAVDVYPVEVARLHDAYPESARRRRRWMTRQEAAGAVSDRSLKQFLLTMPDLPEGGGQKIP
ncbi:MAG: NUDIX domain-containing protein [Hyphomicrobiaceae bacterium]|nr:NUDIX domain-containing protein [Hyphomicrobiaceae bacterium]